MFQRLLSAFRSKPKFLTEHAGKIVPAFEYKGVTYYMFEDIFQVPTIRGLQALDYYDEFSMRCTRAFLKEFLAAQQEILSNPKRLDLVRLATLTRFLQERLDMIPVPEHVYRLASVVFFTGKEDPFYFDRKTAEAKQALWKQDPEILSFFLRTPLKDLIPFLDLQQADLSTYSAIVDKINDLHLSEVLSVSSGSVTKADM